MSFDSRRGILGNPTGMDQGLLGAPPSPLSLGFGSSSGRSAILDSGLGSRIGLDDDLLRSRHSQFGGSESIWDSRGSPGGLGILGEPGRESSLFSRTSSLGLSGLSSLGLDRAPAPLFQQSEVDRIRAAKGDGYGGRSRRRDRMDTGRSGRSPSPRRYRERSPLDLRGGASDDYDPANPTGPSGMTVCHACHVDLGSNQRWREHMQSDGHLMVMQELGCKAEEQAFHLKREMRDNIRRRRRSSGDQTKEPKRYKEGVDNYCKTCEKEFFGPFRLHSELPDHRKRYSMIRDGCRWCGIQKFDRFKDLQAHRASEEHLQKQREHDEEREKRRKDFRNRRGGGGSRRPFRRSSADKRDTDRNGHDDAPMKEEESNDNEDYVIKSEDESAVQEVSESKEQITTKPEPEVEKSEQQQAEKRVETRKYPRTTLADLPAEYDPNMALGQNYIKEVTGFFCKLCRRFYSNEELAFQNHCKSEQHFRKLKVYLQQKAGADNDVSDEEVAAS